MLFHLYIFFFLQSINCPIVNEDVFFDGLAESVVEAPKLTEKANKEAKTLNRVKTHDKETHGTSNDIDENTPIEKVKGPGVFERAKEEIEALVGTIHPKKEHNHEVHTKKEGGFWCFLGRMFEKFCSPLNGKRD